MIPVWGEHGSNKTALPMDVFDERKSVRAATITWEQSPRRDSPDRIWLAGRALRVGAFGEADDAQEPPSFVICQHGSAVCRQCGQHHRLNVDEKLPL
jgi:hypothetical protein